MIVRDKFDRFVVSFDSKKLFEKVVENQANAKIAFESGVDHTSKAAYTVEGDAKAVWDSLLGSGESCISRIERR